jgi:hypothetical protein
MSPTAVIPANDGDRNLPWPIPTFPTQLQTRLILGRPDLSAYGSMTVHSSIVYLPILPSLTAAV